jgi:hypothetical protein
MTNIAKLYDRILRSDLGFEDDGRAYNGDGWLAHEEEPVRFVWEDEESGAFALFRFESWNDHSVGPMVAQLRAAALEPDVFRAVIRGFLHG